MISVEHCDLHLRASNLTRRSSAFTYYLALCLIPRGTRNQYFIWYAYFRLVDDFADSSANLLSQKREYIQGHLRFVSDLYDVSILEVHSLEELLVSSLVAWDKCVNDCRLRGPITDLLSSIEFDINREGTYLSEAHMGNSIEREVKSYIKTLHNFCSPNGSFNDEIVDAGIAAKWSHILRDLQADLKEDVVNVSSEDIKAYDLNFEKMISSCDFRPAVPWVRDKVRLAEKLFISGKKALRGEKSLRYKLAVRLLCAKYEGYLRQIRAGGYDLSRKDEGRTSSGLRLVVNSVPMLVREVWAHLVKSRI